MMIPAIGNCEGCNTTIWPFKSDIYICHYCGEQYILNKEVQGETARHPLSRISNTPLPIMCEVVMPYGKKMIPLTDVVRRFYDAETALEAAIKEYTQACKAYEAVRPKVELPEPNYEDPDSWNQKYPNSFWPDDESWKQETQ